MRNAITVDWAFGFTGALEKAVRSACPQFLRSWPLLQSFNFEAYQLAGSYLIIVLRDKLGGVPVGPGTPKPYPHTDHPPLPPAAPAVALWQFYLRQKFALAPTDAAVVLPIHDSGRNDAAADYALFSPEEQFFWHEQFMLIFSQQKDWMESLMKSSTPSTVTYHVSGPNARVNVNSTDNSNNVALTDNAKLFADLRALLPQVPDESKRVALEESVNELEKSAGTSTFVQYYQKFISLAADHAGLFGSLLPALALLL